LFFVVVVSLVDCLDGAVQIAQYNLIISVVIMADHKSVTEDDYDMWANADFSTRP
jgi:hypothetical protein